MMLENIIICNFDFRNIVDLGAARREYLFVPASPGGAERTIGLVPATPAKPCRS